MERRSASRTPQSEVTPESLQATLQIELPAYLTANLMGGFIWDVGSDQVFLRDGALRVFEFEPGEFDGRGVSLRERVVADDAPGLVEQALAGVDEYGAYFRTRSRDGSLRWAHAQASITRDEDGNPLRAVGIVRNADAELGHAAQQTILASDRRYQADVVQATTAALAQALTVQDLLDLVTGERFLEVFGASGAALSVVEPDRRRLLATTGLPPDQQHDLGLARMDSRLPIADAIRYQTPLFITREEIRENYPLLWPYIEPTDLTSAAILPLAAHAQPIGALAIFYEGRRGFNPEERNLLRALGGTFGQSLQRALMYDKEHSMAVALQRAMLPTGMPEVPGMSLAVRYQPATSGHEAGGDWYDAIALPGGEIELVVGDVQGHDVNAAAVMGQLRAALRAYVTEGHPPEIVMSRASMFLHEMDTDLIATCICAHLYPATGSVDIVRAGHPHPLVRGGDRRTAAVEVAGGVPLGLPQFANEPYPSTRIHLRTQDTLLLCTDGLLESRGSDLDAGERQIRSLLDEGPSDLDELAEHIVATVEKRQGQEDDIALVLACLAGAG